VDIFVKHLASRFSWSAGLRTSVAVLFGVPLAIGLAWVFYLAFERPFLSAPSRQLTA
jgi:hypothetical protein